LPIAILKFLSLIFLLEFTGILLNDWSLPEFSPWKLLPKF